MTVLPASEPPLRISFQPIVATLTGQPFAWAAIAATPGGRSFAQLAAALPPEQRPALEALRIARSIEVAAAMGLARGDAMFALPLGAAGSDPEPLVAHLFRAALAHRFPIDRIVVEINADERGDLCRVAALAEACVDRGLAIAFDRFAVGPLAIRLLGRFTPRFLKLDTALVGNVAASTARRVMIEGVVRLARNMGVTLVANGIASRDDLAMLCTMGIRHIQGDWIAPARVQPLAPASIARREPRGGTPQHRRLAPHHRPAAPVAATACGWIN